PAARRLPGPFPRGAPDIGAALEEDQPDRRLGPPAPADPAQPGQRSLPPVPPALLRPISGNRLRRTRSVLRRRCRIRRLLGDDRQRLPGPGLRTRLPLEGPADS